MPIDLLVPLYSLPPREQGAVSVRDAGIVIRRANPFEMTRVGEFIERHFAQSWADEAVNHIWASAASLLSRARRRADCRLCRV